MIDDLSYEKKKDEASFICENEHAFCILNFEPLNEGHVMVLPKSFARELEDLTAAQAHSFLQLCGLMRRALDSLFEDKAILMQNSTRWRSQPRLHVHILPCTAGLRHMYPSVAHIDLATDSVREKRSEQELKRLSTRIRIAAQQVFSET